MGRFCLEERGERAKERDQRGANKHHSSREKEHGWVVARAGLRLRLAQITEVVDKELVAMRPRVRKGTTWIDEHRRGGQNYKERADGRYTTKQESMPPRLRRTMLANNTRVSFSVGSSHEGDVTPVLRVK